MVQRPVVSLGIPDQIVDVRLSLGDVIAFTENSLGQSRIMQARSGSSSSNSLKGSSIMTSADAGKMALIWGIDISWLVHFLFFPQEA